MDQLKNRSFEITTLGCKVNTYDTSLLEKRLHEKGLLSGKAFEGLPQIHIVNSCAVTEKSSLETHRLVKRLKAGNPGSTVVITGCVAQVDVERLKNLTGADLIVGNSHKGQLGDILEKYFSGQLSERVFHSNIFKKEDLEEGGGIESSRTRAFLKIQDGCNAFCSFCIIPFARGKSRSIPVGRLVSRVNELCLQGFKEVILTGVHIGDYEDDGLVLSDLVEAILLKTKMGRIRLSSLEPIEIDDKLWGLYGRYPQLCPHFHMSFQTGNSKVLADMKRKYGQPEIESFFERMTKVVPQAFVGMDIIAGFPGETEQEFEDTHRFMERMPWTRMHVFPYSIRPGTLAAKREGHLAPQIIHARAKRLRELSRRHFESRLGLQLGTVKKVLTLEKPSHGAHSLSMDYWPVHITSACIPNREYQVKITGIRPSKPNLEDGVLVGSVVQGN